MMRVEVESGPGAFTLSLHFTGTRTAYSLPPTHSWLLDIFPPVRPGLARRAASHIVSN